MERRYTLIIISKLGINFVEGIGLNSLLSLHQKFSQVTHQIALPSVCDKYRALRYYEGVVELSLCAAGHKDPQRLGLHFYKSGQPPEDLAGQKAFLERCVHSLEVLDGHTDSLIPRPI